MMYEVWYSESEFVGFLFDSRYPTKDEAVKRAMTIITLMSDSDDSDLIDVQVRAV